MITSKETFDKQKSQLKNQKSFLLQGERVSYVKKDPSMNGNRNSCKETY